MAAENMKLKYEFVNDESAGTQSYLAPFKTAVAQLGLTPGDLPEKITLDKQQFLAFLSTILKGVAFDDQWYKESYPDIAEAVQRGDISSAFAHFVSHGYVEGRAPRQVIVDERWYREQYPDIAEGIDLGEIESGQQHFDGFGRAEGRLPFKA